MGASLFSFAALAATLFRPLVGGQAPKTVDDRLPGPGAVGGVSSTNWMDGFIQAETVHIATETLSIHPETVAPIVSEPFDWLDDSCIGCASKGPVDCNRCAYFLGSIDKISLETVFSPVAMVSPIVSDAGSSRASKHVPVADRSRAKKPALPAKTAAKLFAAHLRATGNTQFSAVELREQYYALIATDGRRPTAENRLRAEFLKIPGVAREKIWVGPAGEKTRETFWTIQPETAAPETVAPPKLRLIDKIPVIEQRAFA